MSDIAISVKELSKKYQLGQRESYKTMAETLAKIFKGPKFNKEFDKTFNQKDSFFALNKLSFNIEKGEVIGIIGRNGAGKSTLLKILSRITSPTTGNVELYGRVGSLLEVGTGFHPELTGRENIFLNGSLLGMRREEIEQKFEEIIKFSEIEKFLDTPVKRYSSGMYVRLAFAVAAHLEPEILIIDEVLAVGDVQFQKKCLGKMREVSKEGRTVLFVSHNMNAIEQLCSKCMHLDQGFLIQYDDAVREVITNYLFHANPTGQNAFWICRDNICDNPWFNPEKFYIGNRNGIPLDMPVSNNDDFFIFIKGEIKSLDEAIQIGYSLFNEDGSILYWSCHNDTSENEWPKLQKGKVILRSQIPKRFLNQGLYRIEMIVALYYRQWICEPGKNSPSIHLNIQGGLSNSPFWMVKRPGVIAPVLKWDIVKND